MGSSIRIDMLIEYYNQLCKEHYIVDNTLNKLLLIKSIYYNSGRWGYVIHNTKFEEELHDIEVDRYNTLGDFVAQNFEELL